MPKIQGWERLDDSKLHEDYVAGWKDENGKRILIRKTPSDYQFGDYELETPAGIGISTAKQASYDNKEELKNKVRKFMKKYETFREFKNSLP